MSPHGTILLTEKGKAMKEIRNVKFSEANVKMAQKTKTWENIQFFVLVLTIVGQVTVGASFIIGQGVWLIANTIALVRDFALKRPIADKTKNATLWAITCGLVASYFIL